jgi:hypothetical protein
MRLAAFLITLGVTSAGLALAQDAPPAAPAVVCAAATAASASANDRYAGLNRVMQACVKQWQGLDETLERDLPDLGNCGYAFQSRLTEVLRVFELAMSSKRNYYDAWKRSVEDDLENLDRFDIVRKSRGAEIDTALAVAQEELKSRQDRKDALIKAAPSIEAIQDLLKPLDDLIAAGQKTVEDLESAKKNGDETGGTVEKDRTRLGNLVSSIAQELKSSAAERLLWVSYYDLRKARFALGCGGDGPQRMTIGRPGQRK